MPVIAFAEPWSWLAAVPTTATMPPTFFSKASASAIIEWRRSSACAFSRSVCSWRMRARSSEFCFSTSSARAMVPISSLFSRNGISTALSPSAIRPIAPVMPATGRVIERLIRTPTITPSTSTSAPTTFCRVVVSAMLVWVAWRVPVNSPDSKCWAFSTRLWVSLNRGTICLLNSSSVLSSAPDKPSNVWV